MNINTLCYKHTACAIELTNIFIIIKKSTYIT